MGFPFLPCLDQQYPSSWSGGNWRRWEKKWWLGRLQEEGEELFVGWVGGLMERWVGGWVGG